MARSLLEGFTQEAINKEAAAGSFKQNRGDLLTAIRANSLEFANNLYAKSVIPRATLNIVLQIGIPDILKNVTLLDAIESRIETVPSDFHTLIRVLEDDNTLRTFADRLRVTYGELCSHATIETSEETRCSPAVARYAKYLKGVYRSSPVSPDNKYPPTPSKKYINLAVVKKERISRSEADKFTKATLHGDVDEILNKKESIQLEDILHPVEGQPVLGCVFVEGAPGVGKSTLAWEICKRWDTVEHMAKYSLVILLRFREKCVQEIKKNSELFYHYDSDLQQAVTKEIIEREGKGVLFVLDGFDELPARLRQDGILIDLIHSKILPEATVLVTSRPSATSHMCRPLIHKHIEVIGFTQDCIREYATSVLSSDPELLEDFLKYISVCNSPAINSLMYIPLNSAIIIDIYRENKISGRPIPQTMTQLYAELSCVLIKRYLLDNRDPIADKMPDTFDKLPDTIRNALLRLAQVAFEGMLMGQIIFNELPENCHHFGFMNASTELYRKSGNSMSYSFLHLTLQEFLAAFYIAQLRSDQQKSLYPSSNNSRLVVLGRDSPSAFPNFRPISLMDTVYYVHTYKVRNDVIWKFVAGLTAFKHLLWSTLLCNSSREGGKKYSCDLILSSLSVQCLYEAQVEMDYDSVFGVSKICFRFRITHLPFDAYAVGHCIATSKSRSSWVLDFTCTDMATDCVEMIGYGLKSKLDGCARICALKFENHFFNSETIEHLKEFPVKHLQHISTFHLNGEFKAYSILRSFAEIIPRMAGLKEFDINDGYNQDVSIEGRKPTDSPNEYSSVEFIRSILLSSLEKVCLCDIYWTYATVKLLTLLTDHKYLSTLHLSLTRSTNVCPVISPLAVALRKNTTLKELILLPVSKPYLVVDAHCVTELLNMLRVNRTLQILRLDFRAGSCLDLYRSVTNLMITLYNNRTLKFLELLVSGSSMGNYIGPLTLIDLRLHLQEYDRTID